MKHTKNRMRKWSLGTRQAASDYAMAMAGPKYHGLQLLIMISFVLFPLAIGLGAMAVVHSGAYPPPNVTNQLTNYIAVAIPFLLLLGALEVAYAWYTDKLSYFRLNDSISSLFTGISERAVLAFFRGALFTTPYAFLNEHWSLTGWRSEDMGALHWIIAFVGVELAYYWLHRMGHEWNILWAGHNIHHSSDEYNLFTALRQSVWIGFWSFFFYSSMALILPLPIVHMHREINTLYQFWIHTRFIRKLPAPIEYIFNTPSHHRVHHGRNPQYIDKNYGGTLIIFDRIFGTFEPEQEEVVYGITHMPETWNPLTIQTHHWLEMWEAAKLTPGFWRKLRVFLDLGPGYNYFLLNYDPNLKGVPTPPPVTAKTVRKRLISVTNDYMRAYTIVQLIAMAIQLLVLLEALRVSESLEAPHVLLCASLLIHQLGIGALFDQAPSARLLEIFSNLFSAIAVFYFVGSFTPVVQAVAVFELLASLWLLKWH